MLTKVEEKIARNSVLLARMPEDVVATLLANTSVQRCHSGETVFLQDEPAEAIFIVLEGWLKLYRISPSGNEAVVGVFTSGGSFGEGVAFSSDVYPVNAEAVSECRLLRIRAASVLDEMKRSPELGVAMLAATYHHLHDLVEQIEQLKARSGTQRVAEFLLELSPVSEGACALTLPFDKVVLAGRLGMKPESLSRAFARLRAHGVKITRDKAAVSDIGRLRDYAEQDRADAWSHAK